jgi:hypothetical protein
MSNGSQRHQPRHLAGAPRVERPPRPVDLDALEEIELLEVTPVARVQRSRLAFAVSVTLAALPLLVLDNMPATAGTDQTAVEVQATEDASSSLDTTSTTAAPTTTTAAPTTTSTTAAPTTTTTEATTTSAPEVVQALTAPTEAPAPPPTSPPTTSAPAPSTGYGDPADPATWDRLAQCESGGRWDLNSGNGYYGGLQFSLATWQDVGGSGYPHQASRAEQIKRGQLLQARYGWGQWPHCSSELGYR